MERIWREVRKIAICTILVVIFISLIIIYIPSYFITKEGQPCLLNKHCSKVVCDGKNYAPVCNNYPLVDLKCKCRWAPSTGGFLVE